MDGVNVCYDVVCRAKVYYYVAKLKTYRAERVVMSEKYYGCLRIDLIEVISVIELVI